MPRTKSALIWSAARTSGERRSRAPSSMRRQLRRGRLDEGLAEEEGETGADEMSAMPTATSLTRGSVQSQRVQRAEHGAHAARRRGRRATASRCSTRCRSALIAPMTSVPSWPRFTRPLFSVRHSPRLTKRNGVLMRTAPAATSRGTPQSRCPYVAAGVITSPPGPLGDRSDGRALLARPKTRSARRASRSPG